MLTDKIQKALNEQIALEAASSDSYLAVASWCDTRGFSGSAKFFYSQAEEERGHMLKLFHYMNDAGGHAQVPPCKAPQGKFKALVEVYESSLKQEQVVTKAINNLVDIALSSKDFATFNFLQWYVAEQVEEEKQFRDILDKIAIVGKDGEGEYLIDRDIGNRVA